MSYIESGSFKFGDVDMFDTYGIQILDSSMAEDLLLPAIRPRKVTIPLRHGTYDYGAKYYDERHLTLNCVTVKYNSENNARAFAREIAYTLSKKDKIWLWNEPGRYYVGRIENEVALTQYRGVGLAFTLDFTCEPFAYGSPVRAISVNNEFNLPYTGTAPTPTKIIITNTGTSTINNIRISQNIKNCEINLSLEPGERVIIDAERYYVWHNNENITYAHSGEWIDNYNRSTETINVTADSSDFRAELYYTERFL